MDNLIFYLIPIAVLLAILIWLKTPKAIGTIGEWWVRLSLGKNKENEKYVEEENLTTEQNN